MLRLVKILAAIVVLGGAVAATSVPAQAHWHGGWHGGGWHHHHGGWGWGFAPGFALGYGLGYGYPYSYGGYYAGGSCGWTRVRVWHYNHWHVRRVWRCW